MARFNLAEIPNGMRAKIVDIAGGIGLQRRLHAMGVRPGRAVTKCSGTFMRGPVVIRMEGTQVALGYGMARKVLVETIEDSEE